MSRQLATNEFLQHSVLMNVNVSPGSGGVQVRKLMKSPQQYVTLRKLCFFYSELCYVFVAAALFPVISLNTTVNYMSFMSPISHFHYTDARCNMDLLSQPCI